MNIRSKIVALSALALGLVSAWPIAITEPARTFLVGVDIDDLLNPPVSFLQTITDSAITSITKVEVGLKLVGRSYGGFASEMFVSLNKDLDATVNLLNRVGVSSTDMIGAFYDGWDVTFSDDASNGDIHLTSLASGVLTGAWQPDGRVLREDTLRPMLLNQFVGLAGNGDWRLNVADLGIGGTMRLESWSLTLSGEAPGAVPDAPLTGPLLGVAFLSLLGARRWNSN